MAGRRQARQLCPGIKKGQTVADYVREHGDALDPRLRAVEAGRSAAQAGKGRGDIEAEKRRLLAWQRRGGGASSAPAAAESAPVKKKRGRPPKAAPRPAAAAAPASPAPARSPARPAPRPPPPRADVEIDLTKVPRTIQHSPEEKERLKQQLLAQRLKASGM